MIYLALFGIGKLCLLAWRTGSLLLSLSLICAAFVYLSLSQSSKEIRHRKKVPRLSR